MQESFDLTGAVLQKEFSLGCLTFRNAHLWRLSHFVWDVTQDCAGATFFGDLQAPWNDRNLFRVEIYRLPKGLNDFSERLQWYTKYRKSRRIKISDGPLFDVSMLHPRAFGNDWDAESFALSKGEIIRIYRNRQFAIVFRFLARSGTLLDHPIFKRLVKDISFDPQCWEKNAPAVTEKGKRNKIQDSPLSTEEMDEFKQITKSAAKRLGITSKTSHTKRLELVELEIEKHRKVKGSTQEANVQLAIELGAVIGQCFCEKLKWEWRRLKVGRDSATVCVCCPERRLVLTPGAWILGLLSSKKQPVNCLLTFNMIDYGRLPPTRPGAYIRIN
jgi:hypothetical protein